MVNWEQVADWLIHNIVQVCLIISIFIQITPIKINPWSAILKWISKVVTGDACSKIDDLIKQVDENEKDRIRWEVLAVANSCRNGRKHTRDEFQHIVALNDKYKKLLAKTKDKNGVFDLEYNYIQELYAERLEKNDFL